MRLTLVDNMPLRIETVILNTILVLCIFATLQANCFAQSSNPDSPVGKMIQGDKYGIKISSVYKRSTAHVGDKIFSPKNPNDILVTLNVFLFKEGQPYEDAGEIHEISIVDDKNNVYKHTSKSFGKMLTGKGEFGGFGLVFAVPKDSLGLILHYRDIPPVDLSKIDFP